MTQTAKAVTSRSKAKVFLMGCALVLAAISIPAAAHAADSNTGYPCNIEFYPGATSVGNFGNINFQLYTSPNCSGSFVGMFYLATTGSTIGFITYNADQIQTQMRNLVSAWQTNRQVTAFLISSGQGGNVNVANHLTFFH